MAVCSFALHGSVHKNSSSSFDHPKIMISSAVKPPSFKKLHALSMKFDVSKAIESTSKTFLDAFVDSTFQFLPQPLLPSQRNFAPVEEIGEIVEVICFEGEIPADFPEGVFIRNGPNPLFGGFKTAVSIFGKTSNIWVEGEGMLHAVYFKKNDNGNLSFSYKNKYVESETFKMEKKRNKPAFIPAIEGNSSAIIAAYFLNMLRFGSVNKLLNNTSVFEHSGKLYAISESHQPQEIDISTLETLDKWEHAEYWNRPFGSHPKKAPISGELVIIGVDAVKPYFVVGVCSADGKTLLHKADLNFSRCSLSHDVGVTEKYNILIDHPLTIDGKRLLKGGPLIKFEKEEFARIGVMPRYGDADSVTWFEVQSHCTFHILNCFEDGDEVIVRGCRSLSSVLPGPENGLNKLEWFSRGFNFTKQNQEHNENGASEDGYFFTNLHEWRLDMASGKVEERKLTSTDFSMDFPFINEGFSGLKHNYGYTQIIDSKASSISGMGKYGGLAKLSFNKQNPSMLSRTSEEDTVKVEYHKLEENSFCTGSCFVSKNGATEEDDGWIITHVHNEDIGSSQIHVIDAKTFGSKPVAKISLPQRVPYGFHGCFIPS